MAAHGVEVCLLSNDPNVRYATSVSAMPVYAMSTFARCAVVPQEGEPVLFEHRNSVHRSRLRAPDVRPMHAWEFSDEPAAEAAIWADETLAAIRERGATGNASPSTGWARRRSSPCRSAASRSVDSAPVTQEARRVKTPEEVALFELNGGLVWRCSRRSRARSRPASPNASCSP